MAGYPALTPVSLCAVDYPYADDITKDPLIGPKEREFATRMLF